MKNIMNIFKKNITKEDNKKEETVKPEYPFPDKSFIVTQTNVYYVVSFARYVDDGIWVVNAFELDQDAINIDNILSSIKDCCDGNHDYTFTVQFPEVFKDAHAGQYALNKDSVLFVLTFSINADKYNNCIENIYYTCMDYNIVLKEGVYLSSDLYNCPSLRICPFTQAAVNIVQKLFNELDNETVIQNPVNTPICLSDIFRMDLIKEFMQDTNVPEWEEHLYYKYKFISDYEDMLNYREIFEVLLGRKKFTVDEETDKTVIVKESPAEVAKRTATIVNSEILSKKYLKDFDSMSVIEMADKYNFSVSTVRNTRKRILDKRQWLDLKEKP